MTINDIARYAGVSKSTVSRVLNGDRRVSQLARVKVNDAVAALDYRPNAAARSLVLKKYNTFSLIVQDIRNPYYAYASWYAERFFHNLGYGLVIHNADNNPDLEREILETIQYRGVDGALSIGGNRNITHVIRFHSRVKLPLVLIDRELPGYDLPTVNLDNRMGGQLATNHLFELGHQAIAFATSEFTLAEMRRGEGYLEAHRRRGYSPPGAYMIVQSEEIWSEGRCPQLAQLMRSDNAPTAIFASNDLKAIHVMRVLRELGVRVPEDVSVVGYDDVALVSVAVPALTTIHQPFDRMVEAGAMALIDIVDGKPVEMPAQLFEPWLVERDSTARVSG